MSSLSGPGLPQRKADPGDTSPETMAEIIRLDDHRTLSFMHPSTDPDADAYLDQELDKAFRKIKGGKDEQPPSPTDEELEDMFTRLNKPVHQSLFSRASDAYKTSDGKPIVSDRKRAQLLDSVQDMLGEETETKHDEAVEELEFTIPKRTRKIRGWIQKKYIQANNAAANLLEKAQKRPLAAMAVVVGGLAVTAYVSYKFGVNKGSGNSSEVANSVGVHIKPPSTTNPVDKATEWYELYRQNNPGVSRSQFNQVILSDEFEAMCKNPEQFARLLAANS